MSQARQLFNAASRRIGQTHFAESSDIASTSICARKFLLPRILGATGRGNEKYIPGSIAHVVLDKAGTGLLHLWEPKATREVILEDWRGAMEEVFADSERRAEARGYSAESVRKHIVAAHSRLESIAAVLSVYFQENPPPRKIVTEVTISNPTTRHEGRVDAIFEYDNSSETIEWKTNVTGSISQYERIQTVANGMLVNYRYGRAEDDFASNRLTIFTPEGIHHPIPTEKALNGVREARQFILATLANTHPRYDMPSMAVCYECSFYYPCRFYLYDKTRDDVKKLLCNRRFRVLKKRERSHANKFLAVELPAPALAELGIVEQDYSLKAIDRDILTLEKASETERVFAGDSVRVIGLEPNIPLLACVSCNGSVSNVEGKAVKVQIFRGKTCVLQGLPIALLRVDVGLSKRELESIDRVHRNPGPYQDLALAMIGEKEP